MAKLTTLPSQAIINGFKGVVDFYLWQGIPVARRWPRSPGHDRAPAVQAGWVAFTEAAKLWAQLSYDVRQAYETMAQTTSLTGRDLFTRSYITGIFPYPH